MSGILRCGSLFIYRRHHSFTGNSGPGNAASQRNFSTKPINGLLNGPRNGLLGKPTRRSFHQTSGTLLCRARLLLCIPYFFAPPLSLLITPISILRLLHLSARPTPRSYSSLSPRSTRCTFVALLLTISLLLFLSLPFSTFYSLDPFLSFASLPLHTLLLHIHIKCSYL